MEVRRVVSLEWTARIFTTLTFYLSNTRFHWFKYYLLVEEFLQVSISQTHLEHCDQVESLTLIKKISSHHVNTVALTLWMVVQLLVLMFHFRKSGQMGLEQRNKARKRKSGVRGTKGRVEKSSEKLLCASTENLLGPYHNQVFRDSSVTRQYWAYCL